MDLAEIRKKSQQEKERREGAKPDSPAVPAAPSAPPAQAAEQEPAEELQSTLPVPVTVPQPPVIDRALVVAVPEEDLDRPPVDPLTALLAGRIAAGVGEDDAADSELAVVEDDFEEYLYFRLGPEYYAINIMDIKEIIKPREVTEVPRTPDFVSGILSLRGVIIPIFDMTVRLGLVKSGATSKERIVVIKKGEGFYGILVDEVVEVIKMVGEGFEPPPPVLDGIDRDFVKGIGRHQGRMLILLNVENVLDINLR